MQISRLRLVAALAGVALLAAACDGGGGDGDGDGGGDVSRNGIASLGDDFVQAFNADPNSEPVDAQDVTLTLTPTIEPFDP